MVQVVIAGGGRIQAAKVSMKLGSKGALGVIVCQHIVQNRVHICRGSRSEQIVPEDSGWHFSCDKCDFEDESTASIWSVNELLDFDSSLRNWINSDIGTTIIRQPGETNWQKLHS